MRTGNVVNNTCHIAIYLSHLTYHADDRYNSEGPLASYMFMSTKYKRVPIDCWVQLTKDFTMLALN